MFRQQDRGRLQQQKKKKYRRTISKTGAKLAPRAGREGGGDDCINIIISPAGDDMRGVETGKAAYAAEAAAAASAAASAAGVHIKANPRKKKGASTTEDGEQVRETDNRVFILERPAQ